MGKSRPRSAGKRGEEKRAVSVGRQNRYRRDSDSDSVHDEIDAFAAQHEMIGLNGNDITGLDSDDDDGRERAIFNLREESDEDDEQVQEWGNEKEDFYSADEGDVGEEAKEALGLQRAQLQRHRAEDYGNKRIS